MKRKLTTAAVEKIRPPATGRLEIFDTLMPGFALRVTDKGRKSWSVMFRLHGKLCRMTLGTYPVLKLAGAREAARDALKAVQAGRDPRGERAAKAARKADTVKTVVADFIEKHAKRHTRSWAESERIFEHDVLPAVTGVDTRPWGDRPIGEIGQRDVIELLDGYEDRPYMGNRVLAAVRKLFNWSASRGIVEAVPAFNGLAAPEQHRDRPLTDAEIRNVWKAAHRYPFGAVVRLLLLTGQRRAEVGGMRWSEVDLDAKVWTIPPERAKNGVRHEVPLSPAAIELLEGVPRHKATEKIPDPTVFSTTSGAKPVSGFSKAKTEIDKAAGFLDEEGKPVEGARPWRLHDLRHTVGTGLQVLRIPADTIGAILNHKKVGITQRYLHHDYAEEKRAALDAWANRLDALVNGKPANVVKIGEGVRL